MLSPDKKNLISHFKTPFYLYDLDLLKETLEIVVLEAEKNKCKVHYAVKANNNETILHIIQQFGLGADCVSGNEVNRALSCGFLPEDILLAGVGKTDDEIEIALKNNIACINCESVEELKVLAEIARSMNTVARIAIRINPDVDAQTHQYITTGLEANKFGIPESELQEAMDIIQKNSSLKLIGLHAHIGSQICDLDIFIALSKKINSLKNWFATKNISFDFINVGGGLGVNYDDPDAHLIPDFATYFSVFRKYLHLDKEKLQVELGRSIVAQCGYLVTKVLFNKKSGDTEFLIADAGMTDLLRPALYQAYHKIERLNPNTSDSPERYYDVVGPICESSDSFGKKIKLPESKRGDLLVIRSAGAYGEVMASNYNLRDKPASRFI